MSGVSWYDHDGDAYFSLETVLLIRDSVNFATNVDCLCALFYTFAMTYSVFSSIINIQKSPLFTFFELTCPKNIAFRFMVISYVRAFYYQSLPQCPLLRCPLPRCPLPRCPLPRCPPLLLDAAVSTSAISVPPKIPHFFFRIGITVKLSRNPIYWHWALWLNYLD